MYEDVTDKIMEEEHPTTPRLVLIRGLPGSGKSAYAKQFNSIHVENNMFCMHSGKYKFEGDKVKRNAELAQHFVRMCLESGTDVVVSNTFTTLDEMKPYIYMARFYGASIEVYHMTGKYRSTHNVPEATIQKMKDRWQPYPDEIKISYVREVVRCGT